MTLGQPRIWLRALSAALLLWGLLAVPAHGEEESKRPWRLEGELQLPDWLSVSGRQRVRFENLSPQYRSTLTGSDQVLAFRTDVTAEATWKRWRAVFEGMDSRQALADSGSAISASIVNSRELLQGFIGLDLGTPNAPETERWVRFGRQTMDIGSRRLIARNRFRNTVNAFTGVRTRWDFDNDLQLQAFYVLPVERLPNDAASLLENEARYDRESWDQRLWGITVDAPIDDRGTRLELFAFGLREEDNAQRETRDRRLITPGFRLRRAPSAGAWDFTVESNIQWGTSSPRTAPDSHLEHFAHQQHIEVGYTLRDRAKTRLLAQFDHVSGDGDPTDQRNGRFDSLWGARRFDYGPTSIYGPFTCNNLISPGFRLFTHPHPNLQIMFSHRFYWSDSGRDVWRPWGLVDPTGESGRYLGAQPEIRFRWEAVPENLRLELGLAHLFPGRFVHDAPNSPDPEGPTYVYLQSTLWF